MLPPGDLYFFFSMIEDNFFAAKNHKLTINPEGVSINVILKIFI